MSLRSLSLDARFLVGISVFGVPTTFMDTNRTYNPYNYKNEVDNYQQSHYQLHYVYSASKNLKLNAALHYTRGLGYFEQYKGANQNSEINSKV